MALGSDLPQGVTMFSLRPQHLTGVSSVVTRLRTAIDLGFFEDGEMLPKEAVLSKELHVTAFTLREALAELRLEGLVDTKPGRGGGTFVQRTSRVAHDKAEIRLKDLSATALRDLSDWKAMLLGEAAELAASRASPSNIARLEEYCNRVLSATSAIAACRAHARFDIELAAAAQSVRLSSAALHTYEEYSWLLVLAHEDQGYTEECAQTLAAVTKMVGQRLVHEAGTLARDRTRISFESLAKKRLGLIASRSHQQALRGHTVE